jgi:hypothetical protein
MCVFRDDIETKCAGLKWAGYLSTTSVYGDHQVGQAYKADI